MTAILRELLKGNDIPRLDKKVILRNITGFNDAQLISRDDYQLTPEQFIRYLSFVQRLQSGEPLAYIIGYREFYSRNFKVTPATLIPRPETELLVDEVLKRAANKASIVDLGTGTGCIAITLKLERPDLYLTAVDKFQDTLNVASENADTLKAQIQFIQSDWYSNLNQKYDLIVSNPPYIDSQDCHLTNLTFEPQVALTDFSDGYQAITSIVSEAHHYLRPGGSLLIEHGYQQGAKIRKIFEDNSFFDIVTILDFAGLERITLGQLIA